MAIRKKAAVKKPAERGWHGASAFDVFSDSLKATFDLNIFVAPLLAIVFGIIVFMAILALSMPFIIAGIMFSVSGTAGIAPMIALFAIGILVFLAIIIVSSAIITGFYYRSVDEYLSSKKISIEKNIQSAIADWKRLTVVHLVEILAGLAIAVIVLAPAIAFMATGLGISGEAVNAAISSNSATALVAALAPALVVFAAVFALLMAIMFFINPLLFLWFPTAVFEKKPAMECVKKGYEAGRAKYLRNLFALLLMGLIGCVVAIFQTLDPTYIIGFVLSIWFGLASVIMVVKIYREGA